MNTSPSAFQKAQKLPPFFQASKLGSYALILALLAASACGKKGELHPPKDYPQPPSSTASKAI